MRFSLTITLLILMLSGCVNSSRLAPRATNSKVAGLAAGDGLGQSFVAQSDTARPTAVSDVNTNDYN